MHGAPMGCGVATASIIVVILLMGIFAAGIAQCAPLIAPP
jgi:hypothetical protein